MVAVACEADARFPEMLPPARAFACLGVLTLGFLLCAGAALALMDKAGRKVRASCGGNSVASLMVLCSHPRDRQIYFKHLTMRRYFREHLWYGTTAKAFEDGKLFTNDRDRARACHLVRLAVWTVPMLSLIHI